MNDGSRIIAIAIILIIIALLCERCRYEIATDETMSVGEKMYWLQLTE